MERIKMYKVKNKKSGVIKVVDEFLVRDYLATHDWELVKSDKKDETKSNTVKEAKK